MKKSPNSLWWILFLVFFNALAAFGVYYTSLSNGLVWDDPVIFERQLPAFRSVKDLFFPPYGIQEFGKHYYRPLVISSFMIDKAIWGNSPFGFHLTVVLLHTLSTVLVFFLARKIFKEFEYRNSGAFFASLVFAVHPIHAESVNWIAGRSDILAALFFFPSLLLYMQYRENNRKSWLLLSSLLFLTACFAKETSIAMVFLLPIIDLSLFSHGAPPEEIAYREGKGKKGGRQRRREHKKAFPWKKAVLVKDYIPFILSAAVYLAVRNLALKQESKKFLQSNNFLEILTNVVNSLGFYIEKILLPINLSAFIPEIPSGLGFTMLSVTALSLFIGCMIFFFIRRMGILLFSICFFLVTLAPSVMLVIFRISETPLADRYLYIPSFAFCLILGFAFLWISKKLGDPGMKDSLGGKSIHYATPLRIIIMIILLGIVTLYSIQSIERNKTWKNDTTLWEDVVKVGPDHALPHLNLGLAYASQDRIEDAEREYRKALEARSYSKLRSLTFNSLGALYLKRGDYMRAEECFQQAISLRSNDAVPHFNLAISYWEMYLNQLQEGKQGEGELVKKAVKFLDRALQLDPRYSKAHYLYGEILYRSGHYDEARKHLKAALSFEKESELALSAKEMLDQISKMKSD